MPAPRLLLAAALLAAPLAACASGASGGATPAVSDAAPAPSPDAGTGAAPADAPDDEARVTPPRMLSSGRLALQRAVVRQAGAPGASGTRRGVADRLEVEVRIDAEGKPELATLVVRGPQADANRDAIATWISAARFAPARRGATPVPGVFRRTL